jgi:hypothetical protein
MLYKNETIVSLQQTFNFLAPESNVLGGLVKAVKIKICIHT